MSEQCGVVRTGTLGYQWCQRPSGHNSLHVSQDRTEWDAIATYDDGSGSYSVLRTGDHLEIFTSSGEYLPHYLTRAPKYDNYLQPEFILTARYAVCEDYAANGVVWIDGIAYTTD